jgi:hypothetical protein
MGFFPPFLPNLENKIVSGLLILVINWLICFSKELELWDIVDKLGLFLFFFVSNRIIKTLPYPENIQEKHLARKRKKNEKGNHAS